MDDMNKQIQRQNLDLQNFKNFCEGVNKKHITTQDRLFFLQEKLKQQMELDSQKIVRINNMQQSLDKSRVDYQHRVVENVEMRESEYNEKIFRLDQMRIDQDNIMEQIKLTNVTLAEKIEDHLQRIEKTNLTLRHA